jgi:hypothetical protein
MVVNEEPALDVIHGQLAPVLPGTLAVFIVVALPDVLADQVLHVIDPLLDVAVLVARHEMCFGLDQHPDGAVTLGGCGFG